MWRRHLEAHTLIGQFLAGAHAYPDCGRINEGLEGRSDLATRLLHACRTPDERVARAFRMATARAPTDVERRELMQAYRALLVGLLQRAKAAKQLAPGTDLPAAAVLFIGSVQGVVRWWDGGNGADDGRE